MNRLEAHFTNKPKRNLAIYFSAGYPSIESIEPIILNLEQNGADIIEIGMAFSDPLADGPVIQNSGTLALANGITTVKIFNELSTIRQKTEVPLVLMGYLNPVLQFGFEEFLKQASLTGIDGLILPDLPLEIFERDYKTLYEFYNIFPIFLITPETPDDRIHHIDKLSKGFIYAVSSSSTTGSSEGFSLSHISYFERLQSLNLLNPLMIGFGISNQKTLETVFDNASGAIVGSAFIKNLQPSEKDYGITQFMNQLLNEQ